jgi:hypothetical protein
MQGRQVVSLIMMILFIGGIVLIDSVPSSPTPESMVEAILTCAFDNGAHLIVHGTMIVSSISVFDTMYSRQAIEEMSSTNPYVMGAIMLRLHESVKQHIETAFPGALVDTLTTMPSYQNPSFIDDFQVNLTPAFFKYNESLNLTTFITGVLDMGATVGYHFALQAEEGWNTTFVFTLPDSMTLAYANTADTNHETNSVTWVVRNWDGNEAGKDATLSVQAKNPTTLSSDAEDIALEYVLDTRTVDEIRFIDSILVKKVNVHRYKVFPDFISGLTSIPADGVRLYVDNGLFTWQELYDNTMLPIEQQTTALIENSSFDQNLSLSFSWDPESTSNSSSPYNITHMDDEPAIRADFTDSDVELTICQMPARAFFGLINAGATASVTASDVNFGSGLEGIQYPYAIVLRLPVNISLDGDNEFVWNRTTPISGAFTSEVQPNPPYTAEHVETRVDIELVKMDLNIPSLFTGKTELVASVKMKQDDQLYVIRQTGELPLSSKVNLTYLNADAFRILTEENVFTEGQITAFLAQKTAGFQQRLSQMLKGVTVHGAVDRRIFSSSLVWDGDISSMDDMVPVVVSNAANEVYTVGFNMSLWPAELTIASQRFTLQGMGNESVTYRIIFPRGITLNASDSTGKPLIAGKTNDGRDYVELSYEAGSSNESTLLTCAMSVSPVYVFGLFLPCILVVILLVVLITIIYLIRKKRGGLRRGKKKLFEPEDNEPSEYSGEDYYVPPPPSSKKRK